ncbi:Agamous-like mads-box protein agl62 [Thalictrum thalictroides]|uniref:Agamous-like mads-box protein agl62 n=1 Tax=Thalictrum thalictroides TaxID=46969 RepID=A0A7J6VX25_THATH|nr:Agamous-like mads-box protein agl62 [Thalictrum thalictroides]
MVRTKIEMKRIEAEESRQVAFSKRRAGIFKKASELSIMTGAETAVVAFSPGGKVFSFGQPNVHSVVDKFLAGRPYEHRDRANMRRTIRQYSEELDRLTTEKNNLEKALKLEKESMKNRQVPWWEGPIENLGLQQLELLKSSYEHLKQQVGSRGNELLVDDYMQTLLNHMNNG